MGTKFTVEITVPEGLMEGDKFNVEVEAPAKVKGARGQLAGLTIDKMSDDQLKREIINANSVLYKAKQRGAAQETIDANQARVDAAAAEKAKRAPIVAQATPAVAEAVTEGVDKELAAEI